uniref:Complementary sex determiner n=1 Tax=Apis florea TaxID=7463 RepID=A0A0H4U910_APIFL|nr:complementary sex determiner [Apis florea]
MKRNISSYSHCDERFRQSRSEDSEIGLRSRTEERLRRRREEWMIQQELEREHERLKKKMILEYERAREKKLALSKRSKTKSRSPESRNKNNAPNISETFILSEKLKSSDGTSLFRGPEGTQVSETELRKIKVDIHRILPGKTTTTDELKRDIINPENVIIKRRTGEGSKPIFEREEIKNVLTKTNEITEHRTVLAVNIEKSENEIKTCKKYAVSSNSIRSRSHNFQHTSSRYSSEKSCSRDRNRGYKKKDRQYEKLYNVKEKLLREKTSLKRYSRSREREQRSYKNESPYREYRETSRERSRDRRERERSRERTIISSNSLLSYYNNNNNNNNNNSNNNNVNYYIEQIPVPVYYGIFPPRPIMVRSWVPMRGQVPGFRHIGPLPPFPPRFIAPDMCRFRPPNPRFGRMY